MAKAYVFLAQGFEDIEAIAPVDVLRRAGIEVLTVSVTDSANVLSAHEAAFVADMTYTAFAQVKVAKDDCLVFPGGMPGAVNLAGKKALMQVLRNHWSCGGIVASICASPAVVLCYGLGGSHKVSKAFRLDDLNVESLLKGRRMTCYPGFEQAIVDAGALKAEGSVVVDGRLVTSPGPAHALNFGLAIVSVMLSKEKADEVKKAMLG